MKKSKQKVREPKVTTRDVLLAVNKLSDDIDQRFNNLEQRVGNVEGIINTQMVTKDYLDRKFAELRIEENPKHQRVNKLTNILQQKKILNLADTKIILS